MLKHMHWFIAVIWCNGNVLHSVAGLLVNLHLAQTSAMQYNTAALQ